MPIVISSSTGMCPYYSLEGYTLWPKGIIYIFPSILFLQ